MTRVHGLRQEAASLMAAIVSIRREARRQNLHAGTLVGLLGQFEQMLVAYFDRQEAELTPGLVGSGHGAAAMAGREFAAELDDLRKICPPYFRNWNRPCSIESQFDSFRFESDLVLGAIENRLKREYLQLFPAAEELARLRAA